MSCDLTSGKTRTCRTGFGGIDYVIAIQLEHIEELIIDTVNKKAVDTIALASGTQGWKFEFEEETSNAEAIGTGSDENGTYVSMETVTIANQDYEDATRQNEDELSQNRIVFAVAYSDGKNLLYGSRRGMKLQTASHNSGSKHEDKGGDDWVFKGKERKAPYSLTTEQMESLLEVAS